MIRALVAVAILAVVAPGAHADTLDVTGPCTGIRERVAALVGRDPFVVEQRSSLVIAVSTKLVAGRAIATLSTSTGGRRTLKAASCAAIVDDVALAIAIVLASPADAPTPPAAERRAPATANDDDAPASARRPRAGDVTAALELEHPATRELAIVGGVATSSSSTIAAVLGVRGRSGDGSLGLSLALGSADEQTVAPGTIRVARVDFALAPCVHVGRAAACAVLAGGWLAGTGTGFPQSASATLPYAATGLRMAWEQPLTDWLALDASVEGRLALTADRFLIDDMAVWTGARLEAWVGIAAVAHIP